MTQSAALPLIELDHATVLREGIRALDAVSLDIAAGQHTVILGPNGCGKSSFVKLVERSLYPVAHDDGRPPVRLFGQARWNVWELRTRLGLVSADLHADLARMRGLDVEDAVVSGFWGTHGIPDHQRADPAMLERAADMLALLDIVHLRHRRLASLSSGEARRALIARALVHHPQVLLLDESTTGLDPGARHRFLERLRDVARRGVTLVLVTHHVEEVLPECEQVILLKEGHVLASGTPMQALHADLLGALYGLPLHVSRNAEGFWRFDAA